MKRHALEGRKAHADVHLPVGEHGVAVGCKNAVGGLGYHGEAVGEGPVPVEEDGADRAAVTHRLIVRALTAGYTLNGSATR